MKFKRIGFRVYTIVTNSKNKYVKWWNQIRRQLWRTIKRKWFKVSEGAMLLWYMKIIRFIIFPIATLSNVIFNNLSEYDLCDDTRTIHKMKYPDELFDDIESMLNNQNRRNTGTVRIIIKKGDNNWVNVTEIRYI